MSPGLGLVVEHHIKAFRIAQEPLVVLVYVCGIDHQQIMLRSESLVNQKVIHHTTVRVKHHSVENLPFGSLCDVIGEDMVDKSRRVRAIHKDFAHMGDIEHAYFGAHGIVFGDNSGRIAYRHIETGKRTHHGAQS